MADIQQWRRKIQPARAKTPAAIESEDLDEPYPSDTAKQRLKRKVSAYFDFTNAGSGNSFGARAPAMNDELSFTSLPVWPAEVLYPDPQAEEEIDSVICALMAEPHKSLDVRFNCSLMRIFERFLKLKEERDSLQTRFDREVAAAQTAGAHYNKAFMEWQDEKQDYKEEVKRLEVLLSKASKRGVAEVTLARQDSKICHRKREERKETIFEVLEKSKRLDDHLYESQRAVMRPLIRSGSYKDKETSQTLAGKKSMTNIHVDLPFGTPPDVDPRFSLTKISMLEGRTKDQSPQKDVTNCSASESTFSSFSCERQDDRDETLRPKLHGHETVPSELDDQHEIERLADAVARRRNMDTRLVLPQLLEIFGPHSAGITDKTNSMPAMIEHSEVQKKPTVSARIVLEGAVKRKTVMSKASGFFHRLIPSTEGPASTRGVSRRFSFEPGDDEVTFSTTDVLPSSEGRVLRKSASVDVLSPSNVATAASQPQSPIDASSTPSATPTGGRPPSRIPTPVHGSNSLAKQRQEREDSSSSLVTAIRHADDSWRRSQSVSSSTLSSPVESQADLCKTLYSNGSKQDSFSSVRSKSSNRLLDHTHTLRGHSVHSMTARNTRGGSEIGRDEGNWL